MNDTIIKFESFDSELDYKIWSHYNIDYKNECRQSGYYGYADTTRNISIKDHQLIGAKIIDNNSKEIYYIKSVSKQWQRGWYHIAIATDSRQSSTVIYFDCDKCHSPWINNQFKTGEYSLCV